MNWVAFTIMAWLSLGFDAGFRDALRLGASSVAPSFVIPLAVYLVLSTPARTATWAALVLGIAMDLQWVTTRDAASPVYLIGPHALGLLVASQMVIAARGMVIRNVMSMVVLSIAAAAVTDIVVVALVTMRSTLIEPLDFSPTGQLQSRALSALYTGVIAVGLSFIYKGIEPFMGFNLDRYGRQIR